jgi:hypothetical protein
MIIMKQKLNLVNVRKKDYDDSNNNSSGGNFLGANGPLDSGPTNSSGDSNNFSSKIWIIIGGTIETITQVIYKNY